jgi:hypothetical protein
MPDCSEAKSTGAGVEAMSKKSIQPELAPAYPSISDDGLGQPRLRSHLIARRRNLIGSTDWQLLGSTSLDQAWERYQAGTHLLVQARDGDWTLQYLLPRKFPRRPFP